MNNEKDIEKVLSSIKKTIDSLILIELCKSGATRDQVRQLLGGLDNNLFSKISSIFNKNKK
jgi:hypothetical protein